jgi:hypothetical protein
MAISRHTLLRVIRRTSWPSMASPRVLGVDDFAMRKRQTYDTDVIDLERRQPVTLPDGAVAVPVPPPPTSLPAQQRAAAREARRQSIYAQVWALGISKINITPCNFIR